MKSIWFRYTLHAGQVAWHAMHATSSHVAWYDTWVHAAARQKLVSVIYNLLDSKKVFYVLLQPPTSFPPLALTIWKNKDYYKGIISQ
jgi:hypothetical protein